MISILILIITINILCSSIYYPKNEIPLDTSQDILSEGISDPEWITEENKLTADIL